MSAPTILSLYNGATRILKEVSLATPTDNREVRYKLDTVWADGAIDYCLEAGQWFFAMRTSKLDSDPDVTPPFGYTYAFSKPSDWVRTAGVCQDEFFNFPLTQVTDEAGFWFASITPIYVRYVSDGPQYGNNLGAWPETFTRFVEAYLAREVCPSLTSDENTIKRVEAQYKQRMDDARSKAAMNESAAFPPRGTWVLSRWGRRSSWDRGNPGSLIG